MTDDPRDILLSYAARISAVVLDRLGKENVESIFVSGGTARNDVAAFRGPSGIEIYSDLDLFIVARRTADLDIDRGHARHAADCVPRRGENWTIFPEPDIGVFSRRDFFGQKTRPGTAEIADANVVLHGGAEIPSKARKFDAAEIDPLEALYLLENRLGDIAVLADRLERAESDGFRRYVRYVLLKSCLDAGTAILIVLGLFHPSRAERMRRLRDVRSRGDYHHLIPEGAFTRLEKCDRDLLRLQEAFETDSGADPASIRDAGWFLLEAWRRMAEFVSHLSTDDWSVLFEWRCKSGRWVGNARELSVLARRKSIPRVRVLRRARRLARLSPVDAVRLSGVAATLAAIERSGVATGALRGRDNKGGYLDVLDELTRVYGYTTGDVFARARRMSEETA
jgi:hypothetical protein